MNSITVAIASVITSTHGIGGYHTDRQIYITYEQYRIAHWVLFVLFW